MKKQIGNTVVINKFVFFVIIVIMLFITYRICYLGLATNVDGVNIKKLAINRNTEKEILHANRGTIYDINGDILAHNVSSYTVIAYLDESRSKNSDESKHVVDVNYTATSLAPILNMEVDALVKLLTKDLYQVELGPGGRGINELVKDEIKKLNLPGIDFISDYKRYYPNGDFASYVLGYAKTDEASKKIIGEMGIESYHNKYLTGTDGFLEYQKDLLGYKLPNSKDVVKKAKSGNDIYLTLDSSIQLFLEQSLLTLSDEADFEWITFNMMDAKTGKILATASKPSFDPNVKNITNYLNPLTSFTFEPGSTMKTFSYMAALEKGTYKGDELFKSGSIEVGTDKTKVSDWNKTGWGDITYDQGYALSSNVGIVNIMNNMIDKNDLKSYYNKLGFGSITNIGLPKEYKGKIDFKYDIEVANAGFGQGILTTPIQHLKAMSALTNNGKMLSPYIIDKIVDDEKIVFEGRKHESETVAKQSTIDKMLELMYNVVYNEPSASTGSSYKLDEYGFIGKTGTAQVINEETHTYDKSMNIKSVSGVFPYDDPQVILYVAVKTDDIDISKPFSNAVKRVVEDTSKYLKLNVMLEEDNDYEILKVPSFLNKEIDYKNNYNFNYVVLGNGNKIINQYPKVNTNINNYDKVFLLTNDNNIVLPDITNYSKKEVNNLCNITGSGYVNEYLVNENDKIIDINLIKQ